MILQYSLFQIQTFSSSRDNTLVLTVRFTQCTS